MTWLLLSLKSLPVFSTKIVPAHLQQLRECVKAAQHADLAALHVIPPHRHLGDAESELLRDEQNLHVKAEALLGLAGKDSQRRRAMKELESALRVGDLKAGYPAHDGVENLARGFAHARLMNADQRTVNRARADRYVRAIAHSRFPEFIQLFNRSREIGIREEPPLAAGFGHTVANRVALAPISRIAQNADVGTGGGEFRNGLDRSVRRAVIHNHDFPESPRAFRQIFVDAADGLREPRLLVVRRHDDGYRSNQRDGRA